MISYDSTNPSLIIDSNGLRHSPMEGLTYSRLVAVRSDQLAAAAENAHNLDVYNGALANAQANIDNGRHADAPEKKLMKTVLDDGTVTMGPFVPPLADLRAQVVTAPNSGRIAAEVQDTQAIMFAMVQALYRKAFPEV